MKRTKTSVILDGKSVVMGTRTLDVFRLCAEGLSEKEIANKLNINARTVTNAKQRHMAKTKCRSTIQAVVQLVKNNII